MNKILFVDDDAVVARAYGERLAEAGFEVVLALDGVQAMRLVTEYRPDLVILDLLMPKFTGADVLKYIRQHPTLKTTRVIVFSNSFLAALVDQVGQSGVEETLSKSTTTPVSMIQTIREVLAGPEHVDRPAPPATPAPAPSSPTAPVRPAMAAAPAAPLPQAPAPVTPSQPRASSERERVLQEFARRIPLMVSGIRMVCRELLEAADTATETKVIENMARKVGFLSHSANVAGCRRPAQLSIALEALLHHLRDKPRAMTDSCRNTLASAITVLAHHLERFDPSQTETLPPAAILVVDDNPVSNRTLVQALSSTNLPVTSVIDPQEALAVLRATPYDLVLLDVDMPGMDGIALCEEMRAMPLHKNTPVLFITLYSDMRTRSRSILSGGDDFIPKPVMPRELNVKVFAQLLKRQTDGA